MAVITVVIVIEIVKHFTIETIPAGISVTTIIIKKKTAIAHARLNSRKIMMRATTAVKISAIAKAQIIVALK
jgi:hypothetical protein